MIVGFILFMGLSLPAYISGAPPFKIDGAAKMRAFFGTAFGNIINSLAGSGMAVAAILGLILDNVIPGTPEERGVIAVEKEPYAPIT
jgi:xanthine/uracil permease